MTGIASEELHLLLALASEGEEGLPVLLDALEERGLITGANEVEWRQVRDNPSVSMVWKLVLCLGSALEPFTIYEAIQINVRLKEKRSRTATWECWVGQRGKKGLTLLSHAGIYEGDMVDAKRDAMVYVVEYIWLCSKGRIG